MTQVVGTSDNDDGVIGRSKVLNGVHGIVESTENTQGAGVLGQSLERGGVGVIGEALAEIGQGIIGRGELNGIVGFCNSNIGVAGVASLAPFTTGVAGFGDADNCIGVFADSKNGYALYVNGEARLGRITCFGDIIINGINNVTAIDTTANFRILNLSEELHCNGNAFIAPGTLFAASFVSPLKFFKIDHPLDPANKYLYHASIESPDLKTIYDGIAVLDNAGEAVVELPEWFEAINCNFRYQLTPIGASCPKLYIAEEVSHNRFKIAGGLPGMKVSWQISGIRQDPYALANPFKVEMEKPDHERGYYLNPQAYNQPEDKGILRQYEKKQPKLSEPKQTKLPVRPTMPNRSQ